MGFIKDFLVANEGTECPDIYFVWSAYGILSAVIGPKVYLDIQLRNAWIGPDVYILLVGLSGGRKTYALDQAFEMIREAAPDTVFAGDNETYQGVISFLTHENQERQFIDENGEVVRYRPYCIINDELMEYIQNNPVGMVTFLTKIYGKRHYIYKLKHEELVLERPYVMMLSCTTPDWLTDQLKTKQFAEGYGRRTIIVCNETIIRKRPVRTSVGDEAHLRCVVRLQEIQKLVGPFKLTNDGEKWFWDDWYVKQPTPDDKFMRNWSSTEHINALKIALLTSLSESDDLIITKPHLQLAVSLLEDVKKELPMVTQLMGRSEATMATSTLLRVVRNHGGKILEQELKISTIKEFKDTTEQWKVLEFLRGTKQVVRLPIKDEKGIERVWILLPELVRST